MKHVWEFEKDKPNLQLVYRLDGGYPIVKIEQSTVI
jgi:hypothetical protein